MIEGKPIKYGSFTTLRFEIPPMWDVEDLIEIQVSVTDRDGTVLDSGSASVYAGTTLASAVSAEATSVTLASGSEALVPGDRIRIGSTSENAEVREVFAFSSLTAQISPELEYAHAIGANVIGMFAKFDLDCTNTTTYPIGKDLFVRWSPNTADLEEVEQFVIGVTSNVSGDLWEEIENTYPREWGFVRGRDLIRFERFSKTSMRLQFQKRGFDFDKIATTEYLDQGMVYLCRMLILEASSGEESAREYDRASKVFFGWLDDVLKLPIWQDSDQDKKVDAEDGEIKTAMSFCERQRFF